MCEHTDCKPLRMIAEGGSGFIGFKFRTTPGTKIRGRVFYVIILSKNYYVIFITQLPNDYYVIIT
jgi:hypothetical protein